mgnify:CR=1 FL=1
MVAPCEVIAVGAHPDDVELGCGGVLARLAAAGRRVGIVDLTAGEMASRGAVAQRREEARRAAAALGVAWRTCLELPDGGLAAHDPAQQAALVALLRRTTPRAVLAHHGDDPHPDHRQAAELVQRVIFLAGVGRLLPEHGGPWRPALVLAFPGPRQLLAPHLVVDVTASYDAKRTAVAAHASQFEARWEGAGGAPPTHLSSGYFLAAVEGRDRAAGNLIGCEFGEGFRAELGVNGDEVAWLLGAGR